jgi:hypothetical protein
MGEKKRAKEKTGGGNKAYFSFARFVSPFSSSPIFSNPPFIQKS